MIYFLFILTISTIVSSRPADHSHSHQKQNLPGQLTMAFIGKPNNFLKIPADAIYHKRYGTPNYQSNAPPHEYSDEIFKSLGDSFDKLKNFERKENHNFIYEFPSLVSEFIRAKKLEELKKSEEQNGEKVNGEVFKGLELSGDPVEEIKEKPVIDIIYTKPNGLTSQKEITLFKNIKDKVTNGLGQKDIQEFFNLLKTQNDYKQDYPDQISEEDDSPNLSKSLNFASINKNIPSSTDLSQINIYDLLNVKQDSKQVSSEQNFERFSKENSPSNPTKISNFGSINANPQYFGQINLQNIYKLLKMKQDFKQATSQNIFERFRKEIASSYPSNGYKYNDPKKEELEKLIFKGKSEGNGLQKNAHNQFGSNTDIITNGLGLQTLFNQLNGFQNHREIGTGSLEQSELNGNVFKDENQQKIDKNHRELSNGAPKEVNGDIMESLLKGDLEKVSKQFKTYQNSNESPYKFEPIKEILTKIPKPTKNDKETHGRLVYKSNYEGAFNAKGVQNDQSREPTENHPLKDIAKGFSKEFFTTIIGKMKKDEYEPFEEASTIFDQLKGGKFVDEDFKYLNIQPNEDKNGGGSVHNVFEILKKLKDDKSIGNEYSYENEQPAELISSKHIIYDSNPNKDHPTQFPIIKKHVYVHAAPPDSEEEQDEQPKEKPIKEKHYKIIFIKTPTQETATPSIPILPVTQEKTLVYVLVKKPEVSSEISLPTASPTLPSKPEVYYIRYMGKKTKSNGGFSGTNSDVLDMGSSDSDQEGYEVEEKS